MKLLYTTIALACLMTPIYGQTKVRDKIKALLLSSQKVYDKVPEFAFDMNYKLFYKPASSKVNEQYSGYFVKKGSQHYSNLQFTEVANLSSYSISIDNDSRLLHIGKNETATAQAAPFQLGQLIEQFNKFDLEETALYWKCTLTAAEVTFVPYGKVVIFINKQDNTIQKQVLYLLKHVEINENGKKAISFPRLEITFGELNKDISKYSDKFKLSTYLVKKADGLEPAGKYSKYSIVD